MNRKKRIAWLIAALLPLVGGITIYDFVSFGYERFRESLYPELTRSALLQTGLMAEQIRGRLSSMDLLLLMLGGKAEANGLTGSSSAQPFYRYIKNRALLLTPVDRLYVLASDGALAFTTDQTGEPQSPAQRAALADTHINGLQSYTVSSCLRDDQRLLAMSRRFDLKTPESPIILAAEISEQTLFRDITEPANLKMEGMVLFDENGTACAAYEETYRIDYGDIAAINAGGIIGGNKTDFQGTSLITLIQVKDFPYQLAVKYDLSPQIDSLERSRSTSLAATAAATIIIFTLVLGMLRLSWQKSIIREQTMQKLEGMVAKRTEELNTALTELEKIASRDQLTGILNRRGMMELLNREYARIKRSGGAFSVALGDIDHFKRINDTMGHDEGDSALTHVVRCLNARLRQSDAIARWGGEEFLIYLGETKIANALTVTEEIRKAVETCPWKPDLTITCSFGVATLRPEERLGSLITRADEALYRAKKTRNTVSD